MKVKQMGRVTQPGTQTGLRRGEEASIGARSGFVNVSWTTARDDIRLNHVLLPLLIALVLTFTNGT